MIKSTVHGLQYSKITLFALFFADGAHCVRPRFIGRCVPLVSSKGGGRVGGMGNVVLLFFSLHSITTKGSEKRCSQGVYEFAAQAHSA